MTSRRLVTLAVAALIVIVAGLWLAGRQTSDRTDDRASLYPELDKQLDAVDAVRIYKAGDVESVGLVRKDGAWTVTERAGYPADEAKLRTLLIALSEATIREEKTSKPEHYATLGVEDTADESASGVRIELGGVSEPVNLIVGKQGLSSGSQYVRRAGEAQSWLVDTSIDTASEPDAWLRKAIVDVSADRMQSAAITMEGAKTYTAAKSSRADADFAVEGLPKGKSLSSPSAANGFATALTGLTLSDVEPASAFEGVQPADRARFTTFDGLVVEAQGWERDEKRYVALDASFDAALAERFKVATAADTPKETEGAPDAAEEKPATEGEADATTGDEATKPVAENVEASAAEIDARLEGWVFEIPDYKYEAIFRPVSELTGD